MFGMALTRPSLTMQLMSGVDVFAQNDKRWTLRATIVTIRVKIKGVLAGGVMASDSEPGNFF